MLQLLLSLIQQKVSLLRQSGAGPISSVDKFSETLKNMASFLTSV
jgi:hypothetical protein